jgi:hypothetical protein
MALPFVRGWRAPRDWQGKGRAAGALELVFATDPTQGREAIRRVRAVVDAAGLATHTPKIRYGLSGDLYSGVSRAHRRAGNGFTA